jgi:signal transduction histidine kinase/ligand-binding sensor domain-containing protein
MSKPFSTCGLLLCLLFLCGSSQRVVAQYRFDHWTADNGLPQNSVRGIVQTRDGYLWLTTFDGLVRFDGVRFTVFNKSNSPGIITNRFVQVYEDGQGDLWASTENSGLTRLHQGSFTTYTTENELPDNGVDSIGDDGYGNLMIFCGTHLLRWMDGKFQPANDLRLPVSGESGVRRSQTLLLPCNFVSRGRISCFVNGELRSWSLTNFPLAIQNLSPVQDHQGNIWFGSEKGLFKTENGRVVKTYTMNNGLPGKFVNFVYGQMPLQVLTRRDDQSLWITELDSMQSHLVAQRPPEEQEIFPHVCYADREGNIWIGTLYNGLYRARRQSVTTYAQPQGLTNTEVYPIFEDRAGTIWVGGYGGLYRFNDGAFTNIRNNTNSEGISASSIYQDRAGQLWVGGAWRLKDGRFVRGFSKDVWPDPLPGAWTMCEDREGALWFGTGAGVVRYQNSAITRYTTKDGLAGDDTKVIIEDSAGGIWIGSYGGLTHFQDGRFTSWTERDGLPGATVRALYQDSDGVLWIGTYDGGLGRFKDGHFTRYTVNDGLYHNGVFQILEDSSGWFWMSCNRGIYRVRKQELNDFADGKIKAITSVGYGKSDGMLNVECNGGRWPAGIKAHDGKLWFPTMGGAAVIDPATVSINSQPPPVVIESLLVDRVPTAFDKGVRITPGQENFEIQYTALSFINSDNLHFKYKLEGLDNEWIDVGTRRTAYFSHLPTGDYTFRVIAANSDGVWNEEGKSIKIVVLPPFYKTWWFMVLAAFLMALVAYTMVKRYLRKIERERLAQQTFARQLIASQEQERKRIAAELHDSLGQRLVVIKNLALMFLSAKNGNANDVQQIEELSTETSQAIGEVKAISYNLRPYQLDRIGLTKAVEAIVRAVQSASAIDFRAEIDDIDDYFPKDSEINFYRIVQECVNNVVKHSSASAAFVNIKRTGATLVLEVSDNGKGFTPRQPESKNGGFGLIGIAERAELLGGKVEIKSAPEQGAMIKIRLVR